MRTRPFHQALAVTLCLVAAGSLGCRQAPIATEASESLTALNPLAAAREALARRSQHSLLESRDLFGAALEQEPDSVDALAGRSIASSLLALYDAVPPREALDSALLDAERAVSHGPEVAEAHAARGLALYLARRDFETAEPALRRAIALDPTDPNAFHWLAMALTATGKHGEAISLIEQARELSPDSLLYATKVVTLRANAGDLEGAAAALAACEEKFGQRSLWLREAGWLAARRGRFEQALALFERALEAAPNNDGIKGALGWALARSAGAAPSSVKEERERKAAELRDDLATQTGQWRSPLPRAIALVGAGKIEAALDAIQAATDEGDPGVVYLRTTPAFEALKADPRFAEIAEQVLGLATLTESG